MRQRQLPQAARTFKSESSSRMARRLGSWAMSQWNGRRLGHGNLQVAKGSSTASVSATKNWTADYIWLYTYIYVYIWYIYIWIYSVPKIECQGAAAANGVQSPGTSRSHRSRTPCVAQTICPFDPIYRWLSYVKMRFSRAMLKYQTAIKMGVHGSQVTTNMANPSSPHVNVFSPWLLAWNPHSFMVNPHNLHQTLILKSLMKSLMKSPHEITMKSLIKSPWNHHEIPMKSPWNPLWNHHEITMKSPWNHHEIPYEITMKFFAGLWRMVKAAKHPQAACTLGAHRPADAWRPKRRSRSRIS